MTSFIHPLVNSPTLSFLHERAVKPTRNELAHQSLNQEGLA